MVYAFSYLDKLSEIAALTLSNLAAGFQKYQPDSPPGLLARELIKVLPDR